eukprot:Awhi_evm1s9414
MVQIDLSGNACKYKISNATDKTTKNKTTKLKAVITVSAASNSQGLVEDGPCQDTIKPPSVLTIFSSFHARSSIKDVTSSCSGNLSVHGLVEQQANCHERFKEYHAKTGWIFFWVIFVVVICFNFSFLGLILANSPGTQSIMYRMQAIENAQQTLVDAKQILLSNLSPEERTMGQNKILGNMLTLADIQFQGLILQKELANVVQDA